MAIVGKHNVIELVRIQKAPYWRLYENNQKRQAGNYIDQADFSDSELDPQIAADGLRRALERLSTGTYILVAYTSKDKSKGGIDTLIEIEGTGSRSAAINGVEDPGIFVEGIGKITSENFSSVIDLRIKQTLEAQRQQAEQAALKKEVEDLRKQVKEQDAGMNKGLMAIGGIAYTIIKGTPEGREFIGMATKAMFAMRSENAPADTTQDVPHTEVDTGIGALNNDEEQLVQTLEVLQKDNPHLLQQLKKLAEIKQKEPETFKMAIDSLDSL